MQSTAAKSANFQLHSKSPKFNEKSKARKEDIKMKPKKQKNTLSAKSRQQALQNSNFDIPSSIKQANHTHSTEKLKKHKTHLR